MNRFNFILPLLFSLIFLSCGLINPDGGNHPVRVNVVKRIYSMKPDGTGIKFLTHGTQAEFELGGKGIYYVNVNLYHMSIDGTGMRPLMTEGASVWDYRVSNDGEKIAVSTFVGLYSINSGGTGQAELASGSGDDFYTDPCFSDKDSAILYKRSFALGMMNSDGGNKRIVLPSDSMHDYYQPQFTPDGENIIYTVRNYWGEWSIRTSDLKDYLPTVIYKYTAFHDPSTGYEEMKISPNNMILFPAMVSDKNKTFQIHILNLNTKQDSVLTDGYDASFSGDFSKVLYTKPSDPDKAVYIYDLTSGTNTEIKTGLQWAVIAHPKLSEDRSLIIFEADSTYTSPYY